MKGGHCSRARSPHQHHGLMLPYLWNENESGDFLLVAEVNCVNCVVCRLTLCNTVDPCLRRFMLKSALRTSELFL